jgi:hypothetical protein
MSGRGAQFILGVSARRWYAANRLCPVSLLSLIDGGMPKGAFLVVRIWDARAMGQSQMREIGKHECQKG